MNFGSFLRRFFPVVFSAAILISNPAPAAVSTNARTLTLEQALVEVKSDSPLVQRSQSAEREASSRTTQSWSAFLPQLSFSANYLTNHEYAYTDLVFGGANTSVPNLIPTSTLSLNGQWNLFDGFASTHRLRSAHDGEASARHEKNWATFQTEEEVTLQFYRALGSKILVDVAEQNLKTLQDHLRDVQLFKKVGTTTSFDVLRVDVQVSEAKSELLKAQDQVYLSQQKLNEALGRDTDIRANEDAAQSERLVGNLPVPDSKWITNIQPGDRFEREDLQAQTEFVSSMRELDLAAANHWFPRVDAFGQYQQYNNRNDRFDDQNNYREAYTVGLSLTWNLFDGFSDMAKSSVAMEKRIQAEKTLRIAQLRSSQEFEENRRKFLYSVSVFQSRSSDIDKSTESVRLAKEGQKVGLRTNTDLLDAESDLFRARAGQIQSQLGSLEALINLELVTQKRYFNR